MAESLFDIFGDYHTRQIKKNDTGHPLFNNENMGKNVTSGPYKPNEPAKKCSEQKKSFLSNAGKAIENTSARKVFTPRTGNVVPIIYSDNDFKMEDVEFVKPKKTNDYCELFEYLNPGIREVVSPPATPPPVSQRNNMEFDCSYQDEFFTDDFSNGSLHDDDDDLILSF